MPITKHSPMGPGWFIFFQNDLVTTAGGSLGTNTGKFVKPGVMSFKQYTIQSNNKIIVLLESGLF